MNLLFDLDGTLSDPKVGITQSINYALAKFNRPPRDSSFLEQFIGPSVKETFRILLDTDDHAEIAQGIAWYRERYFAEGWLENTVYAGIPDLLYGCRDAGHRLYIATSKRQDIAERVLVHFQLAPYFAAIYGCDVDLSKAELLAMLLQEQNLVPSDCLMIGDRKHDVTAGHVNGILAVGVLWGFGSAEELTTAGANYLVETPAALLRLVCNQGVVAQ